MSFVRLDHFIIDSTIARPMPPTAAFMGRRYPGPITIRCVSYNSASAKVFYHHFTICSQRRKRQPCGDLWHLRKHKRLKRLLEMGLIRFGECSVACVLRNFSEIGAALDVGVQDFIPDQFKLIIVPKKKVISCNVIWRKGSRIGVSFC